MYNYADTVSYKSDSRVFVPRYSYNITEVEIAATLCLGENFKTHWHTSTELHPDSLAAFINDPAHTDIITELLAVNCSVDGRL